MESSEQTPASPPSSGVPPGGGHDYPLTFSVDYPDRRPEPANARPFGSSRSSRSRSLPATIEGGSFGLTPAAAAPVTPAGGIAILVIPVLLMLLFRKKYPRWWYDWNLQLTRFTNRIGVYFALMDDRYPSTDEEQAVHLNFRLPRRRERPQPRPAACQVAARDPALHRALLSHDRGIVRRHHRLVRDPLHGTLPAAAVQLH